MTADADLAAWVRANTDLIRQAIFDATDYRDEHRLSTRDREYVRLGHEFAVLTGDAP